MMHFSGFLSLFHDHDMQRKDSESNISRLFNDLRKHIKADSNSTMVRRRILIYWFCAETDFLLSSYIGMWEQENKQVLMQKYFRFSLHRFLKFLYQNILLPMDEIVGVNMKLDTSVIARHVTCDFRLANFSISIVERISFIINNYANVLLAKISMKD